MTRTELPAEMHREAHRLRSVITILMAVTRRLGEAPSDILERSQQNANVQFQYLTELANKMDAWTQTVAAPRAPQRKRQGTGNS
ncbi:MAG: hypothetical protein HY696_03220 [Deltaproteobacteria bacterium]|nr:hypothetical protein [Deltaproteobacteria bacterium]